MSSKPKLERFEENVLSKYQIYNGIFTSLPFDEVSNTGALLPLFTEFCQKGYAAKNNPEKIVEQFFAQYLDQYSTDEQLNLLFRFIQYIERQVVLFDAIEDAAFPVVNNMDGRGTIRNIREEAKDKNRLPELKKALHDFSARIVLTAHPTQFYPGSVLGIINDLAEAIREDDIITIKELLAQLGKTPFFKQEKPTPLDEAVSLIWYLENVFYHAAGTIFSYIRKTILKNYDENTADKYFRTIALGFWPGGDRDGNPYVTTEITLKTAEKLRMSILRNYLRDFRQLKRRLTFAGLETSVKKVEGMINDLVFNAMTSTVTKEDLLGELLTIREKLVSKHQSLFLDELDDLINKVTLFGFHFASLDIRQDARKHQEVMDTIVEYCRANNLNVFPENYADLSDAEQVEILASVKANLKSKDFDGITQRTLGSIEAMQKIQQRNGELACNRYIISNCGSVKDIMHVYALLRLTGWEQPSVDIIPLFETVPDLKVAHNVMQTLYTHPVYSVHMDRRNNKQTIMLGFSDGTKDGGYLMANWGIYQAKEALTKVSRNHAIDVAFFDGRGGPPARGGGNTHQFYASQGPTIESKEVQLTIQGQTISSNFGTLDSCQFNLEQLLSSGINNAVFTKADTELSDADRATMNNLAESSYQAYIDFKQHPKFIAYLEYMSTLKYYAKTNIGSRPSKRGNSSELNFSDLRAIPFVGSWSQLKQNVPGFFGVGNALKEYEDRDDFEQVQSLYQNSAFFRALISNSMMSLSKSFFGLTAYMRDDPEYGKFWELIHNEYQETRRLILKLTGFDDLMENEPANKGSIRAREQIVLPLLTIQQFALMRIRELEQSGADEKELEVYQKMVTRSLFGNINASRNSA
ncbi:MAG: phosphoenolpyruvate carboxylase [Gammaproteobacteria bacterium]|nr:phosphoenolpyruvate carboxylase [Gammaproteobacteria bacterium]